MKKITLILSLVLFALLSHAQEKFEEVIYLKNGSVIHGMIVEFVPNQSIKIKSGPNLFSYKFDEIEKITREMPAVGTASASEFKTKGYFGIVELGFTDFPAGGGNLPMFSINVVNGYHFNRYISLGAGVGADISGNDIYNFSVTGDFRGYFTKTKVAPFAGLIAGYNMQIVKTADSYYSSASTNINHGVIINPNIGVRVAFSKKLGMSFSAGYKMIGVNSTSYDYYYGNTNTFGFSHGVVIKAGINF